MICHLKQRGRLYSLTYQALQTTLFSSRSIHWINFLYSGLNLNQYGVASPCRTICTVCGFVALS
ncbi:hypothetical protein COH32_00940 [Neisseria meningitidis]|nr:hypothetical protein COH32_00940 [Neisseria meningitidis]